MPPSNRRYSPSASTNIRTQIANIKEASNAIVAEALSSLQSGLELVETRIASLSAPYKGSQNNPSAIRIDGSTLNDLSVIGSKIARFTITGSHIENLTITGTNIANATIDDIKIISLSASKVNTGTLVVGGSGTNANVSVLNALDTEIAWMGKSGTDYGIWGETLRAGGTSYSTAKFRASSTGVEIDDALITLTAAGNKQIIIDPEISTIDIKDPDPIVGTHSRLLYGKLRLSNFQGGIDQYPMAELNIGTNGAFLQMWDTAGDLKVNIQHTGYAAFGGLVDFAGGTSTSATAGGQTVPVTATGFIKVLVNGSEKRVPYYET